MTKLLDSHPTPGEIVDLRFGEAGAAATAIAAHVAHCEACRRLADEITWAEALLATDEEPPADGLERVLAVVSPAAGSAAARPARAAARIAWLRAAGPSAAAVAAGAAVIRLLGPRVVAAGLVPPAALEAVADLSGFGVAAAVFFAVGSLVTLTVAPFLILEGQSRALRGASR